MPELGKLLVAAGIALALAGALLWFAPHLPWLGRLPGDLRIERPGLRIYLPITSCIIASLILTLIVNWLSRSR